MFGDGTGYVDENSRINNFQRARDRERLGRASDVNEDHLFSTTSGMRA